NHIKNDDSSFFPVRMMPLIEPFVLQKLLLHLHSYLGVVAIAPTLFAPQKLLLHPSVDVVGRQLLAGIAADEILPVQIHYSQDLIGAFVLVILPYTLTLFLHDR